MAVRSIKQQDPEAKVYSINRYQKRECDFCVIITTRVAASNVFDKNVDFSLDSQCTTVALSRAKEAVIIIRDKNVLYRPEVWKTCTEEYSEAADKLSSFYD